MTHATKYIETDSISVSLYKNLNANSNLSGKWKMTLKILIANTVSKIKTHLLKSDALTDIIRADNKTDIIGKTKNSN